MIEGKSDAYSSIIEHCVRHQSTELRAYFHSQEMFKSRRLENQIIDIFHNIKQEIDFKPSITAEEFMNESNIVDTDVKIYNIKSWILATTKLSYSLSKRR